MSFKATAWAIEQTTGSCQAKLILICLSDHHNKKTGLCCPSVKTLAEESELSVPSVNRAIKKLADGGFIKIVSRFKPDGGRTSSQYQLLFTESTHITQIDPLYHTDRPPLSDRPTINQESNLELKPIGQNEPDGTFDQFWEAYPKKVKKQAAKKIWAKNKLNHLVDKLVRDVTNRKENCRRWKQGYVPDPTTYLNGERWEDEIQIDTPEQKKFTLPRNVDELMAFGTKMGMPARPGEDEFPYRQRLQAAL